MQIFLFMSIGLYVNEFFFKSIRKLERRQRVEKVRMSKGVGDGGGRRRREQEGETVGQGGLGRKREGEWEMEEKGGRQAVGKRRRWSDGGCGRK